jgi:hypothetical protein
MTTGCRADRSKVTVPATIVATRRIVVVDVRDVAIASSLVFEGVECSGVGVMTRITAAGGKL